MSISRTDSDTMLTRHDDIIEYLRSNGHIRFNKKTKTITFLNSEKAIDNLLKNLITEPKAAKDELIQFNTVLEMDRLSVLFELDSEYKLHRKSEYDMLKYIAVCVEHDPLRGDYYDESNRQLVVDAGRMLNEAGGLDLMREYANDWIVAFIPNRYRREIDLYWDDICGWRS